MEEGAHRELHLFHKYLLQTEVQIRPVQSDFRKSLLLKALDFIEYCFVFPRPSLTDQVLEREDIMQS